MRRMAPVPPQFLLPFIEGAVTINPSPAPPRIPVPFPEKQYIDMVRTSTILGVSLRRVYHLRDAGLIEAVQYRKWARARISYDSVAALCNRLREQYAIKDRRRRRPSNSFRLRDEELLPIPLGDTIGLKETLSALGYGHTDSVI